MSFAWWLWLFAACVLAVSTGGFALLLVDRLVRNRRGIAVAASRAAILNLLADGRLSDSELQQRIRTIDRQGALASVLLEAHSLILGAPRRAFVDRLELAGAAERLRRRSETGPRNERLQAIAALSVLTDAASAGCLKRLWRDPDPWVRLAALMASLQTVMAPGFDTVIDNAAAVGVQLRGRAQRLVRAVATANNASARHAVLRCDLPSWLRLELLEALRRTSDSAVLPTLLVAAMDPVAELRASAVRTLGEIGTPDGFTTIMDAIDDPAWLVRVHAVAAAGTLRLEGARALLAQRLEDGNWWVRLRAGEAMRLLDEVSLADA